MRAEGYIVDVYCDLEGCSRQKHLCTKNKRAADKAIKKAGWLRLKGRDYCPEHWTKQGKKIW
jgi:hypothetical protein